MKLHQLVERTNWLSVWNRFKTLYPNQTGFEEMYLKIYQDLKVKSPILTTTVLVIDKSSKRFNSNVIVLGIFPNHEIDYALEFNSLEEWLGMEVEVNTLAEFSLYDIVAHCIYEISSGGTAKPSFQNVKGKKLDFAS